MLFDSHTHLQFSQFDGDREEIIRALGRADIKVINVGTDLEDSKKAVELAKKYPGQMWATVGLHPGDVLNENFSAQGGPASGWDELEKLASDKKVVAIGECGLDYYRNLGDQKSKIKNQNLQKEIFIKHIELAKELNKPLMIHCRPKAENDAYFDLLEILKFENLNIPTGNGMAHFFAGSQEIAKQFLDLGFYISFAGPIAFAKEYEEAVAYVPLNKILIETDSPFAAPAPHRGKRNEPAYVEFVARKIAEIKHLNFEAVAQQTSENAKKLFNLKF